MSVRMRLERGFVRLIVGAAKASFRARRGGGIMRVVFCATHTHYYASNKSVIIVRTSLRFVL